MNKAILKEYGIDYAAGVSRCLNDEAMFARILGMFLEDDSFSRSKASYEKRDYAALFRNSHELKGVSGNAALTDLFKATSALVEYLKSGKNDDTEIDLLFAGMETQYNRIKDGVTLSLSE